MLTMAPRSRPSMSSATAWQQLTTPSTFSAISQRRASSSSSSKGAGWATPPALLTSTSTGPKASWQAATIASTDARSVTSVPTGSTSPASPAARAASASCLPVSTSLDALTTWSPSRANSSTSPRPIPPLPPVTIAGPCPARPSSMVDLLDVAASGALHLVGHVVDAPDSDGSTRRSASSSRRRPSS